MANLTVEGRSARLEWIAGAFAGNVGGKGVRELAEYFMGYYTIWLALVKRFLVPFWELEEKCRKLSAKFDNPIAGIQARLKGGPELLEGGDQG
jgi:hypothetical protein